MTMPTSFRQWRRTRALTEVGMVTGASQRRETAKRPAFSSGLWTRDTPAHPLRQRPPPLVPALGTPPFRRVQLGVVTRRWLGLVFFRRFLRGLAGGVVHAS